jgi:V8-like Glu-specific endopeptidase
MRAFLAISILIVSLPSIAHRALAISNGWGVLPTDSVKSVTVSIYSYDDDCTGVKIAPRFILTARHCRINDTTRVIFPGGTRYKIIGQFEPSRKSESEKSEHDLTILKIEEAVRGPVAGLADDRSTPQDGAIAWIAGYGGQKPSQRNNPLRKIQVKMVDRSYSLSAVVVRTTKRGSAACDGDSGGPGYTERDNQIVVWGIDSAPVDGDSTCSNLEVFAKVAAEHDWIKKTISDEQ